MTGRTAIGSLVIRSADDVASARQRVREAAARLGFDLFDQVQIAAGVSEIGREIAAAGGGELKLSLSAAPPRRLIVAATGIECGDELHGEIRPGVAAGRRLVGPPVEHHSADHGCTFSRLLPRSAPATDLSHLLPGPMDRYDEVQRDDTEMLRLLEMVRARDAELESLSRELEETNRGVLALYSELDDRAESVRRASEERSRFLSNVTHELRTPLSSIVALCRLLLTNDHHPLGGEQVKQLGYIQKSAQDLLDFISDLLDLARVEAGKVTVRPAAFEAEDLFAALRGMFRPLIVEVGFPVVFEPARLPTMVTDENKVNQILRNLIANALKFTEKGQIRISARHDTSRDEIVFTVADSGIGISAEDLNRIFDEFVQVDARRGTRERSSGLGLPLSRRLAELMGGTLKVESRLGAGSTFTLTLPRVYTAPSTPSVVPEPERGYVLVVDDDQISRYVAKEQLERRGWRVVEAADGEMALRLAREGNCRAIVSDLAMPGMSGFELLDRLGENPATAAIPVVIRTSVPVGNITHPLTRAAAVFSKDYDSIQSVVDRVTTSVDHGSSEP